MSLNELSDDLIDAIRSAFDARKRAAEQERLGPEGYWNDDISVMKQSVSGALLKLADGNGYLHVASDLTVRKAAGMAQIRTLAPGAQRGRWLGVDWMEGHVEVRIRTALSE